MGGGRKGEGGESPGDYLHLKRSLLRKSDVDFKEAEATEAYLRP